MTARTVVGLAGRSLVVLSTPPVGEAQRPSRVPRIGVIATGSLATSASNLDAFRQGLRELGHVEGRSVLIEYRCARRHIDTAPDPSESVRGASARGAASRGLASPAAGRVELDRVPASGGLGRGRRIILTVEGRGA